MGGEPFEHAEGEEGHPAAGPAHLLPKIDGVVAGEADVQVPSAVRVAFGEQLAGGGLHAGVVAVLLAEVIQAAQDVVRPEVGEGEPGERGHVQHRPHPAVIGDQAAVVLLHEELALEQVFLSAQAGGGVVGGRAVGLLVLPERVQHGEGAIEGAALGIHVAVPAAILQLRFPEEFGHEAADVLAEVDRGGRDLGIDAGFHLAVEVGVAFEEGVARPDQVLPDLGERGLQLGVRRLDAEVFKQGEDVHGGIEARVPGTAAPTAIGILAFEQLLAPAFHGDAVALGLDGLRGGVEQVAHHLPAQGGVRLHQPGDELRRNGKTLGSGCGHGGTSQGDRLGELYFCKALAIKPLYKQGVQLGGSKATFS